MIIIINSDKMENTDQITKAINDFLESIGETNLTAKEIIFDQKEEKKAAILLTCKWVWNAKERRLEYVCIP